MSRLVATERNPLASLQVASWSASCRFLFFPHKNYYIKYFPQSNEKVCIFANVCNEFLMKKILITGASGFIGSFIVEEAIRRGMETWAAVRRSSSREYLQDERIHFIELDFSSVEKLQKQLSEHQFNYVVHAAGVTKCLNKDDFFRVNRDGTHNFVQAIKATQHSLERFVFLSSLSIFGAIREQQPYKEIDLRTLHSPIPHTEKVSWKLSARSHLTSPTSSCAQQEYMVHAKRTIS